MSKAKGKGKGKKKEELPAIQKYQPEFLMNEIGNRLKGSENDINILKDKLNDIDLNLVNKRNNYKNELHSLNIILENCSKENTKLNEEIKQIREEREDFEKQCQENFDKKFEQVQEEKKEAIKKITDEMINVKANLEVYKEEKDNLLNEVEKLKTEVQKLNNENDITIQGYEEKIKNINELHHSKLKQTTEIFEKFLKNNTELLTTDLYTVYNDLKIKLESKNKECVDYKSKNVALNEQNKMFKMSMSNNDAIINECARAQVEAKKKTKKLQEILENKDKILKEMETEYESQIEDINLKFSKLLDKNQKQINNLKNELETKKKKLINIKKISKNALNSRSELEMFFEEQLKECKKEIYKKRQMENEKKNSIFPFISMNLNNISQMSNSSISTNVRDDSVFITANKNIEMKDIDPEYKEKIIRGLFNKLNECDFNRNYKKLKEK